MIILNDFPPFCIYVLVWYEKKFKTSKINKKKVANQLKKIMKFVM